MNTSADRGFDRTELFYAIRISAYTIKRGGFGPRLDRQGYAEQSVMDKHEVDETIEGERAATFALHKDPPPFRIDQGGAVRVGNSRICFDLIVEQYENGMTPEDMVRAYDTLLLPDVYAAIAYYLRHGDEVRAYVKRRQEEAETLRVRIESERPRIARDQLVARRSTMERDVAPARE